MRLGINHGNLGLPLSLLVLTGQDSLVEELLILAAIETTVLCLHQHHILVAQSTRHCYFRGRLLLGLGTVVGLRVHGVRVVDGQIVFTSCQGIHLDQVLLVS